jgi:hypothetical protein
VKQKVMAVDAAGRLAQTPSNGCDVPSLDRFRIYQVPPQRLCQHVRAPFVSDHANHDPSSIAERLPPEHVFRERRLRVFSRPARNLQEAFSTVRVDELAPNGFGAALAVDRILVDTAVRVHRLGGTVCARNS